MIFSAKRLAVLAAAEFGWHGGPDGADSLSWDFEYRRRNGGVHITKLWWGEGHDMDDYEIVSRFAEALHDAGLIERWTSSYNSNHGGYKITDAGRAQLEVWRAR